MGNLFSLCTSETQNKSNPQIKINNSEYKTLQVEDKTYILFNNEVPGDCFEI